MLDWLKPKKAVHAEATVFDIDGNALRDYDDVVLLHELHTNPSIPTELRFYRGVIPAGTVGTIIIIHEDAESVKVQLEFSINGQLSFGDVSGVDVRVHRRREEKLKHA